MMDQPVDHGDDDDVAEDFAPTAEGPVGRDDRTGAFVAGRDELEEQVGGFGFEGDGADLVDDVQWVWPSRTSSSGRRPAWWTSASRATHGLAVANPAVLCLGMCVEIWSEDGRFVSQVSAWRRYQLARGAWFEAVGLGALDPAATQIRQSLIANGGPWSLSGLGPSAATRKLALSGVDQTDVPALRQQAAELVKEGGAGLVGGG